jgi:phosphoribosylformylglycinamidine (FGAM) synthase PurS component
MTRCVEISLIIPDNEAATAAETLRRLGFPGATLTRADLYRLEVDAQGEGPGLLEAIRRIEELFNPNKHALRERGTAPEPGEVWIHEIAHGETEPREGPVRIAGRTLPGVNGIERFTVWRLADADGAPATDETVTRAAETLLCNPAFQVASIR